MTNLADEGMVSKEENWRLSQAWGGDCCKRRGNSTAAGEKWIGKEAQAGRESVVLMLATVLFLTKSRD